MELELYEKYADHCFRDKPAPCSSACPLGLDVRKFVERVRSSKWNSAYSYYREQALFPVIVSLVCHAPCRNSCVREHIDTGINIPLLEQTVVSKAKGRLRKFQLPKRDEKIAVIGAGMAGLSCAQRLLSHGYQVDVYERELSAGGRVLDLIDPKVCRADIEKTFSVYDRFSFLPCRNIASVQELNGYDAVCVTCSGDNSALLEETGQKGVFFSAEDLHTLQITETMAVGLDMARRIEEFFQMGDWSKTGNPYHAPQPDERFYALYQNSHACEAYADPEKEASRCLLCNCDACQQVCPIIQKEKKFPRRITSDIIASIKANVTGRPGVRMAAACTFCGKCKEVCPESIDMGACFREARIDFYEDGHFAPAFHDYWMSELFFVQSDEAYYLHNEENKATELFFPGCQMGASNPELVKSCYEFIQKTSEKTGLLLSCCGVPAEWAGDVKTREKITDRIRKVWEELDRPLFIMGCTACQNNMKRYLPEVRTITIYQWIVQHREQLPYQSKTGEAIVFDSCGAGNDSEIKDAVRDLVGICGYSVRETANLPSCCGFGGHIYPSNPELFEQMLPDIPKGDQFIVYCSNCKDVFAWKGFQPRHILEEIFELEENESRMPDLLERREKRKALKRYYSGEKEMCIKETIKVEIPENVLTDMNRLLVLKSQVTEIIREAEETGVKFLDSDQGLFYANHQYQHMTVWVCYRKMGNSYLVEDVYLHHLEIKE